MCLVPRIKRFALYNTIHYTIMQMGKLLYIMSYLPHCCLGHSIDEEAYPSIRKIGPHEGLRLPFFWCWGGIVGCWMVVEVDRLPAIMVSII